MTRLEDLKRICDEAHPGPWMCDADGTLIPFIAAARTYMPKLIRVAELASSIGSCWAGEIKGVMDGLREALADLERE